MQIDNKKLPNNLLSLVPFDTFIVGHVNISKQTIDLIGYNPQDISVRQINYFLR